jgi:hypothetical protein
MSVKFVQLVKGTGGKKFKAVFFDAMRKKISSAQFGDVNYLDYTQHGDMNRQQSYLARHSKEDFENFMKPASLSRWVLWSKPTLSGGYKAYRQRFGLELF